MSSLHPLLPGLACALALFASGSAAASDLVFHEITDPDFVNRGPGADGRLGTADDNDFAADPATASLDLNGSGSASWIYAYDLPAPIPGGTNELIQFSRGNGSLRFVGFPPLTEGGAVDVFAFRATDDFSRNPMFDLPERAPHVFQIYPGGSFLFAWSVRTCLVGTRDLDGCDFTVVENDVTGGGWIWPVDTDPRNLPSIDTFPVPGLPEYMEFLATLVPPETTMLSLAYIGPLDITADNTRGGTADLLVGGKLVAFLGGYSTDPAPSPCPEPRDLCGRSAQLDLVEKLRVQGKGANRVRSAMTVEFGSGTWLGRVDDGRVLAGTWKRSGAKRRAVKLFLSQGAPLATLAEGARALADGLLGEKSVAVPAPSKLVLELDRDSTVVRPSPTREKSRLRIGQKDRKVTCKVRLSGEIQADE